MRLLTDSNEYGTTLQMALDLSGSYDTPVVFHCYWNGVLNEKHLYSILSCYYFHVHRNKHSIILWLEDNQPNEYNEAIKPYATLRDFSLAHETPAFFEKSAPPRSAITFYSDFVRTVLLYTQGGIWFDLDCLFLRSLEPLLRQFGTEICLYRWQDLHYPNNAIYISLKPEDERMKENIELILDHSRGWGFQDAKITYSMPLDILVLPFNWFDPSWMENPYQFTCDQLFEATETVYTLDTFFTGSFCYHWHNKWNVPVHETSPIRQLVREMQANLLD